MKTQLAIVFVQILRRKSVQLTLVPPATLSMGAATTSPASPLVTEPSALLPLCHLNPEIIYR